MRVLWRSLFVVAFLGVLLEVFVTSRSGWTSGLSLALITIPSTLVAVIFLNIDVRRRDRKPPTPGRSQTRTLPLRERS